MVFLHVCTEVRKNDIFWVCAEFPEKSFKVFKDFTKRHAKWNHPYDKTGRSKIDQIIFDLKNNTGSVVVSCYFWSTKIKNKEGWQDSIRVELYTKKYADWLRKEAHTP